MIRKIIAILIVLVCILAAPAFSFNNDDYRTYLTLGGGVSLLDDLEGFHSTIVPPAIPLDPRTGENVTISSEQGFNGFIATGRAYNEGRVEFSLGFHSVDLEEVEGLVTPVTTLDGSFKVATFLVSVFWDFNTDGAVSPYFGGGIGVCQARLDDTILLTDNRDTALAYQLGFGLSFNMGKNTQLDVGYKMLSVVEPNLGPIDQDYLVLHNGNAAIRFLF